MPTRGDASNRRSFAAVPWKGDGPIREETGGWAVQLALAGGRCGAADERPARDSARGPAVAPAPASCDPSPEHGLVSGSAGLPSVRLVELCHVADAGPSSA